MPLRVDCPRVTFLALRFRTHVSPAGMWSPRHRALVVPGDAQQSASLTVASGATICLRSQVTDSTVYEACSGRIHLNAPLGPQRPSPEHRGQAAGGWGVHRDALLRSEPAHSCGHGQCSAALQNGGTVALTSQDCSGELAHVGRSAQCRHVVHARCLSHVIIILGS